MGIFGKTEEVQGRIIIKRFGISKGSAHLIYPEYFMTIELDNKERIEYQCNGRESGLFAENDRVVLTHKNGWIQTIKLV